MQKQQLLDPSTWPLLSTLIKQHRYDFKKISTSLKEHGISAESYVVRYVWNNIIHTCKPIEYPEESREIFILGVHYKASVPLIVKALLEKRGINRFESQVKNHFQQQIKQALLQFVGIFIKKKSEKKTLIEKLQFSHFQAFLRLRDIDTINEEVKNIQQSVIAICRLLILFIQHYDEPRSSKYVIFSAEVNKEQVERAITYMCHCSKLLYRIKMHSNGKKMSSKNMMPQDPFLIDYLTHYEEQTENLTEYPIILQQHDNWRRQLVAAKQELLAPKKKCCKFVVYDSENDQDLKKLSRKQIKLLNQFEEEAGLKQ